MPTFGQKLKIWLEINSMLFFGIVELVIVILINILT